MSVSINLSEGNQVTIQRVDPTAVTLLNLIPNEVTVQQQPSIAVSLSNTVSNQVNVQQQDNIAVSLTNQTPNAVTINSSIPQSQWGSITGTITNQTDLVNYIAGQTPDIEWGNVTGTITDQTDLVNYVAGQIPSTPDLAQVLQAGTEAPENGIVVKKVGVAYQGSLSYTLPIKDGSVDQVIQTDGNGILSFVDLPASATWGNITGTLSNQTDLQTALDAKEDNANKSTSTSLGTSNTLYPTQNAVKVYVDNGLVAKENTSNKSTDVTMGGVSPSSTLYTTEYAVATYVQNEIAAAQAGIPTFEIDMFANYKVHETDEDGTTTYVGKIKATNGNWLVERYVDNSGDITATYANASNNASYTALATAWTNRSTLTYTTIDNLTSI